MKTMKTLKTMTYYENYENNGYQQLEAMRGTVVQAGSAPKGLEPISHCGKSRKLKKIHISFTESAAENI